MTAYNAENTIASAIESMLQQTFTDFSLLVVNDGSTDRTGEIVQKIAAADDRVLYWPMEHVGLCTAVNAGLAEIQSRYVARMDADDLSHPARLEKQMDFIQRQPEVKVVGAHAHTIANNGRHITRIGGGPATIDEYVAFRQERKPFFLLNSSVLANAPPSSTTAVTAGTTSRPTTSACIPASPRTTRAHHAGFSGGLSADARRDHFLAPVAHDRPVRQIRLQSPER